MVVGRHKIGQISQEPLLKAYWEIFTGVLSEPGKKLFVIGYGFSDEHVNSVIANAVTEHQLELYILSPQPSVKLREEITGRQYGKKIWSGLRAHFPGGLINLFPGNQSDTAMWRDVQNKFFTRNTD